MDSIKLMVEEHENILRMLEVVRKASYGVLSGERINEDDFQKMIAFIRNYADVHHHGKEEQFLFNEMKNHLGQIGNTIVTHGMLVEHDWGRLFIRELDEALKRVNAGDKEGMLDVIANAVGYANHLRRHIDKENKVVYTFAEKKLSPDVLDHINQKTAAFEEEAEKKGTQKFYLDLLKELEGKYLCK